jgi:hypothetical protein
VVVIGEAGQYSVVETLKSSEITIRPDRFVVGVAVVAALLVVTGFAAVLIVQRQPAPQPDLSTPDGTVLAYLQAYRAGSDEEIRSYYSKRLVRTLDQRASPGIPRPPIARPAPTDQSQRVQIVKKQIDGPRASITLSITTFRVDSPVSPSEYSYQTSVPLVLEDSQWKLDQEFFPG